MDAIVAEILPQHAAFDPGADEKLFSALPAKWCVALLCDVNGEPLQLMCAKNLRATLKRRLEVPDEATAALPTKRVDYRELVRSVRWRRVDGEFEMDLAYVDAARACFPTHWRRLVPERSAHFVACDVDANAPDFVRDTTPLMTGSVFGPFADRTKADRWIDAVRDAFDLCRYRNILAQAPHGKACAYKQMNKCPAPCDGTIAMNAFRVNVRAAIDAAREPASAVARMNEQMRRHAANLEFEQAGKAKSRAAAIEQLCSGAFAGVRPIERFQFVTVQPGPRKGTAKLFLVTVDGVAELAAICVEATPFAEVNDVIARAAVARSTWPADVLLGTICFHLAGARTSERFVERDRIDADTLGAMLKAAMKIETKEADAEPVRETRLQLASGM